MQEVKEEGGLVTPFSEKASDGNYDE